MVEHGTENPGVHSSILCPGISWQLTVYSEDYLAKTSLSVLKRERQNERRRMENRRRRKVLKDKIRQLRATAAPEAAKLLPEVQGLIDREARRNTIHRNTARRLKSRLARTIAEKA